MHEEFTDSDRNSIRFVGSKIYSVQTCHIYYTSYDLQRQCDTVNPPTHPDIMLRSPVNEEGAEPYWHARVLGIYHANVWAENLVIPGARTAHLVRFYTNKGKTDLHNGLSERSSRRRPVGAK